MCMIFITEMRKHVMGAMSMSDHGRLWLDCVAGQARLSPAWLLDAAISTEISNVGP